MIETPYSFETKITNDEFKKIGQFACRWALIEHTIGNCLRVILRLDPKEATAMIFPLSLDLRMQRINELKDLHRLNIDQGSLFEELRPLIRAMQYIRNTTIHGIAISPGYDEEVTHFHLRSKGRDLTREQLFGCEELINYTAHVALAFRYLLGEKGEPWRPLQPLPDRPAIPEFLPSDCRTFGVRGRKAIPDGTPARA